MLLPRRNNADGATIVLVQGAIVVSPLSEGDNEAMAHSRILYEDGRPYAVPETLEELTGPTSGVVELPTRLDWSEQGRYDLSDPRQRNLMYEVVIRESMRVDDLRAFIHGPTLARVWRRLWLPRKVRSLWESRFPNLAKAA
jgi:hypothetical protein